ncbi:glycosyltransferase family 2 protein [soil metagenome]
MTPNITAIIPARDEADRISDTLEAVCQIANLNRVIVVDDGSRDATAALARAGDAEIIESSAPGNPRGKGRALVAGLAFVRRMRPEAVLIADADLGPSASKLSRLVSELNAEFPFTIATFPPSTGGGFGLLKEYARREIFRRTGYSPAEPLSGQRALLFEALEVLPGIAPGFGAEVGMTVDLLAAGIKPLEVPIDLDHRATGRALAGFAHRARQGVDVVRALKGSRIPC